MNPVGLGVAGVIAAWDRIPLLYGGTPFSRSLDIAAEPDAEKKRQEANECHPVMLPDFDKLYQASVRGYGRKYGADLVGAAQRLGISLNKDNYYGKIWAAVKELYWQRPTLSQVMEGRIAGIITAQDANFYMNQLMVKPQDWEWVYAMLQAHLTPEQALAAWKRGYIKESDLETLLRRYKLIDPAEVKALKNLSFEVPSPSDVIRFAVREAFNEDQVKKLGLDEEFDQQGDFLKIAYAGGVGKVKLYDQDGKPFDVDLPRLFWRAHWELPSPSQVYSMLHRLREGRIDHVKEGIPGGAALKLEPVTIDTVKSLLKAADYSPTWRDRLTAISYNAITRRDAKQLYTARVINRNELKEIYQDEGYSQTDAENLVKLEETKEQLADLDKVKTASKQAILEAWRIGAITREVAARQLYQLTLTTVDEWNQWINLPPQGQEALALLSPRVRGWLDTITFQLRTQQLKVQIMAVKYQLLEGLVNIGGAQQQLTALGIIPERITYYVTTWQVLRDGPRKTPTLQTFLAQHLEGVIGDFDLRDRLLNSGYTRRDTDNIVSLAGIRFRRRIETELAKQLRDRQRELDRLKKELEKSLKPPSLHKPAVPPGPPLAMISKLLNLEVWDVDQAVNRLKEMGWKDAYITAFLEETAGG